MIWHPLSETDIALCLSTVVMCIIDYITGIVKAIYQRDIASHTMKKGLLHKLVYLCIILVSACLDTLGVTDTLGLPLDTTTLCTSAIILIELSSIIENACAVNPNLADSPIGSIFNKTQHKHKE